jgi:hypothetical protein
VCAVVFEVIYNSNKNCNNVKNKIKHETYSNYVEKLTEMIDNSSINSLIVIIMEVPCCGGLWQIAQQAQANAKRKIAIKKVIIGIEGNLLRDE